jgi:hypothetical protein
MINFDITIQKLLSNRDNALKNVEDLEKNNDNYKDLEGYLSIVSRKHVKRKELRELEDSDDVSLHLVTSINEMDRKDVKKLWRQSRSAVIQQSSVIIFQNSKKKGDTTDDGIVEDNNLEPSSEGKISISPTLEKKTSSPKPDVVEGGRKTENPHENNLKRVVSLIIHI